MVHLGQSRRNLRASRIMGSNVNRSLDVENVSAALRRAARRALNGTREERSGRFLLSSVISSVEYSEGAHELDVTFPSGKTYRYLNVPLEIYDGLLAAESKGEFF